MFLLMSTFSVVATPIGNLEDVTLRALRTFREADLIPCEDTRVTSKLLAAHGILGKSLASFPSDDRGRDAEHLAPGVRKALAVLHDGGKVAFATDAGTPGISDPGGALVALVRAEVPEVKIEAIAGPSALAAALSVAGVPLARFRFLGFPPHKKGREAFFREVATSDEASVFYESPHRLEKALASLDKLAPSRRVVLCRELTKKLEEVAHGTPAELISRIATNPNASRGEFVVIVPAA